MVLAGFLFHKKQRIHSHIIATNNVPDAHTPTSARTRMLSVFITIIWTQECSIVSVLQLMLVLGWIYEIGCEIP